MRMRTLRIAMAAVSGVFFAIALIGYREGVVFWVAMIAALAVAFMANVIEEE